MAYRETSVDIQDRGLYRCRVIYAAFLYDEFRRRRHPHARAVALAVRKAGVTGDALRIILPRHNRAKRELRNRRIMELRAEGYSQKLIADLMGVSRYTVRRVIQSRKETMNAVDHYSWQKNHRHQKYGDIRLPEEKRTAPGNS